MDITGKQASEALQDVDAVGKSVQAKLAYAGVGPILMVWGLVCATCFVITHVAVEVAGWAWLVGNACGIAGTVYLGWVRPARGPVLSASAKEFGRRLGVFWLAVFAYIPIWLTLLTPWRGEQMGAFITTAIMFAYVVLGLWLRMPFFVGLGVLVAALTFGGYFVFYPEWMNLWLAGTGGGALLAAGAYLTWRWR